MDLVASLVNSLAWPASAAVMVYISRRSILKFMRGIGEQFPRATRLSMGAGSVQFAMEMVEELQNEQRAEPPPPIDAEQAQELEDFAARVNRVLAADPAAAVLMAFDHVETALRVVYKKAVELEGLTGGPRSPYPGFTQAADDLWRGEYISQTTKTALTTVHDLQLQARYTGQTPMRAEAAAVVALAIGLARSLRAVQPQLDPDVRGTGHGGAAW
ncbi:hypothetical protein [Nocardia sp. NPDC050789]